MSSHPYSDTRPAGPRVFVGYHECLDSGKANSLVQALTGEGAGSTRYRVLGERKSGKTSFLLKLQDLLYNQIAWVSDSHWITIPLYISCKEHETLLSLCQAIVRRAGKIWEDVSLAQDFQRTVMISTEACLLPTIGTDEDISMEEVLETLEHDLSVLTTQSLPLKVRLVLLLDDPELVADQHWIKPLLTYLKSLLTIPQNSGDGGAFCGQNLALVVAWSPRFERIARQAHRIVDDLQPVQLRCLSREETGKLITEPLGPQHTLEYEWVDRIYRETGGHPWLVQYIMTEYQDRYEKDSKRFERNFEAVVGNDFQKDSRRVKVFQSWLEGLRQHPQFTEVCAYLALYEQGATSQEIQSRLAIEDDQITYLGSILEKAENLGVIFEDRSFDPERYILSGIFRRWFLKHTGISTLTQEISALRDRLAESQTKEPNINKPFYLLLSLDHRVLVADGFYTRFCEFDTKLRDRMKDLLQLSRRVTDEFLLNMITGILSREFVDDSGWIEVWDDYLSVTQQERITPRFIFKVHDLNLLDFPIELLGDPGNLVAHRVPMFKEIAGLSKKRAYHLSGGCFQGLQELNVLLVASNCEGEFEDDQGKIKQLSHLPHTGKEVGRICELLIEREAIQDLPVREIRCLTDEPDYLPTHRSIKSLPPTVDNLLDALRGGLGIKYHVFHYCGHYIFSDNVEASGFALLDPDAQLVKRINDRQLSAALRETDLRFAYLSACRSGETRSESEQAVYRNPIHTCLIKGVPATIGMRWPVYDSDGCLLSSLFYESFRNSGVPELALLDARIGIRAKGGDELASSICWAAPLMVTC